MLAAVFELSMQLETECFGVSDIVVEPACQIVPDQGYLYPHGKAIPWMSFRHVCPYM